MTTPKLTPDQLHRLIDEVAELVEREFVFGIDIAAACYRAGSPNWWLVHSHVYHGNGQGHAGLSAVLILLSEGG